MFLAIVDSWLIALESRFVNPLQAFALILWNACASHQEPTCSKLCLSITTVGCQFIPENTLFEVLLYTVTIPVSCTNVLLGARIPRKGCAEHSAEHREGRCGFAAGHRCQPGG